MNLDSDKQLEAILDRELKRLPALEAPATLLPRVLAVIEQRAHLPWYRRAWQTWPRPLQTASLAALTAMFGALCFAGWEASHAASVSAALQGLRPWFSGLGVIWATLSVLAQAVVLSAKQLGPLFLAVCLAAELAAYLSCLGLGTAFVRLTVPRR